MQAEKEFSSDVEFLKNNSEVVVLESQGGKAKVVVSPGMQGRIVTSTTDGKSSFGWIYYSLIRSGQKQKHINAFGGEDRFWIGPDGGQYSVFTKPGEPFDGEHYQTPEPLDWGRWDITSSTPESITMEKTFELGNASGHKFNLSAKRVVRVYGKAEISEDLGVEIPAGVDHVGFESFNTITNLGSRFDKKTGLLSIWTLGMMQATPQTAVVVPFKPAPGVDMREVINADYFGRVPDERLKADMDKGVAFFCGDSRKSSKIGVGPKYAKDIFGSWSPERGALTIVKFSMPSNAEAVDYVNSMWEVQKEPYKGDVINSYNDGPNDSGAQLGEFYELETSSPALTLGTGEKQTHTHKTFHFTGNKEQLCVISKKLFGIRIDEMENKF